MIDVQADASNQLVSLSYSQRVDVEKMKRGVQEIQNAPADMLPGFRLLNDLSETGYLVMVGSSDGRRYAACRAGGLSVFAYHPAGSTEKSKSGAQFAGYGRIPDQ